MSDVLPAPPEPVSRTTRVGGGEAAMDLVWFEWPARDDRVAAPTILLVHATGFHARCWDRVIPFLDGQRVIAVDVRGHGRSGKVAPFSWDRFGSDLIEFVDALGLAGAIGVGHSMGGHSVTEAAAARPDAFSRLVLVDPVILAPEAYAERSQWIEGEAHPTAKRRNRWRDWREMYDRFADRPPFARWAPAVLEDYCRHGVLPAEDGDGFVLACPPQVEAAIYMGSTGRDVYAEVAAVRSPVTVLRAKARTADRDVMDFSSSPTFPGLAECFPAGRDVHLAEHSHFIPMEDPALVADVVLGRR